MDWKNKLIKKGKLNSPVVEQTPVIWNGRLMLVETWQCHYWDKPPSRSKKYYVRIRNVETGDVLDKCMEQYCFSSALIWDEVLYVFAARYRETKGSKESNDDTGFRDVNMSKSDDLVKWTKPKIVLAGEPYENLLNQSVCHDGRRFVMAYESNDPAYPPYTIKFAVSDDLEIWIKIPDAIYGTDRYTACPALRHVGDYYYMLYLERLKPKRWFETWLTRSKDLISWEDAPRNPVIVPDPDQDVHSDHPEGGKECNASDPDLVEWRGKTRVYFTGGDQHWGGNLQYAEFDGTMQEFFESYYV